ncbi:BLUF domain-containing protein [Pseudosulfitobacter koreensis]|uniref:BLUF domain-containing protein n=1 Tax=Pseudosulfitobacter koreensis TaxID=2968472 RepID=A0ABT1YZ79_9RHOB|nr:BLUF domain-containing protein [Pseudosulfitobacter koreense]MCR8826183.1 BLUF domain-containing protein [Pseudosulfitobacter koreense]
MLHQLVYVSSSTEPISPDEISRILETSRQNNDRDDVTGLLLYHDQLFFQVLEGDQVCVQECFDRIKRDRRHGSTSVVWEYQVERRAFPQWSMGYAKPEDLSEESRSAAISLSKLLHKPADAREDPVIANLVQSVLSDFRGIT